MTNDTRYLRAMLGATGAAECEREATPAVERRRAPLERVVSDAHADERPVRVPAI
jgi:hypothetical protein